MDRIEEIKERVTEHDKLDKERENEMRPFLRGRLIAAIFELREKLILEDMPYLLTALSDRDTRIKRLTEAAKRAEKVFEREGWITLSSIMKAALMEASE